MKVLLYFEDAKWLAQSGIGRALEHQKRALTEVGIDYTTDPHCTDYDILHINTYSLNSTRMVKRARKMGKKVIYHAHSTEEDFRNSFIGSNQLAPFVKRRLIRLYSMADMVITPSAYSKKLLEGYGLTLPIFAVSNGVDIEKYQPNPQKEQQFREYFQIKPDEKVVICVGLFFNRKGILDFVEVAKELPEYRFIWFGHTPMWSIPREIRQVVTKNHPKNVLFPGYIKGDIIEGAYSASDLFFFPSYEETEGIVVLEALASQQTILIRDIPVYAGLTDHLHCYKGQNNQAFKEIIPEILEGHLPDTKQAGYQFVQDKSIESVGQELKQIYELVQQTPDFESLDSIQI